jgi:hypothetical protein
MTHSAHGRTATPKSTCVKILLLLTVLLAMPAVSVAPARGKSTHETFFAGTDYELNVYSINGATTGKTILIIGGIQGDEPGGFLSADLYADMRLEKGKLIVVPRANFYSILLNKRQVNEDMNRKFSKTSERNFETHVVTILKGLIEESDCLLNLHDGSGFYSETWQDHMKNPMRFGQSIIADCEEFNDPNTGRVIKLGDMARKVVEEINKNIKDPQLFFKFNNHRTNDKATLHPEQRKSATYYALFTCGIPAFGIETSKSLPLETRVLHHKLAVNAFMNLFDITPETPGISLEKPTIKYLVAQVNDHTPLVIADGDTLNIAKGDTIKITNIEGNYQRGYAVDIKGYGSINDLNKPFIIEEETQVIVRKDNAVCGNIAISLNGRKRAPHGIAKTPRVIYFNCRINRKDVYFPNGTHVDIMRGDQIELVDVVTFPESCPGVTVNLKGFVPEGSVNKGEDRGHIVNMDRDLWTRYSLYNKGRVYQVVVEKDEKQVIGRLFFDIADPLFQYIVFQTQSGVTQCFFPNDTIAIGHDDSIKLIDIKTSVPRNFNVTAWLNGNGFALPLQVGSTIDGKTVHNNGSPCEIVVSRGEMNMGRIVVDLSDRQLAHSTGSDGR